MPTNIIVDMRCMQDPTHAERGIATHARSAMLLCREVSAFMRDARIIGLIDPNLAPLPATEAAIPDEIRPNAYAPDLTGNAVLVNPSPMTVDQAWLSRLLLDQSVRKAAFVYDFIPFDEPHSYLKNPIDRLDYLSSLVWLNRNDLFLPISDDTRMRLGGMLALGSRDAVVTGVPLAPWFEGGDASGILPRHILTIAGDDPRKNPELLVRAHAQSEMLQSRRIPLVIGGHYRAFRLADFRALTLSHGGDPELVSLAGRVPRDDLQSLYRNAYCVVTPSRAEGFSMPVIEAMAMGVPSIGSDIPTHQALIHDPQLRFGPDDHETLGRLLERFVNDSDFRAATIAAQQPAWQPFRATEVARSIWSAVENLAPPQPLNIHPGGRRPKIAMLTPLPPAKSGISDFSARLALSFGERAELSLFCNAPTQGMLQLSDLAQTSSRFDRVVSVMGNSSEHYAIYDLLARYGGACICHDARLLHFTMSKFGLDRAAKIASEELGRIVTVSELGDWEQDENLREANFFGGLAQAARPLIFHNRQSVASVKERFRKTAFYLPFAVYRQWPDEAISPAQRSAARRRLNIITSDPVIVSLGFIHASKGIEAALHALASLRQSGITYQLYWVGQAHQDITLFKTLALDLGISERVHFKDRYFTEAKYRDYVVAADYGLQLRMGSGGNISGALSDCIAAGLPTVASADIAENINAPSFVCRVASALEPEEIAAAFMRLFDAGLTRETCGDERFAYCETYSMTNYAKGLCDLLEV